ncbi:MAG: hypothetical protein GYA16_14620 [Spirochaetes bacterium]|nr:hypothetical protein [Spirochaetota bacterium]
MVKAIRASVVILFVLFIASIAVSAISVQLGTHAQKKHADEAEYVRELFDSSSPNYCGDENIVKAHSIKRQQWMFLCVKENIVTGVWILGEIVKEGTFEITAFIPEKINYVSNVIARDGYEIVKGILP